MVETTADRMAETTAHWVAETPADWVAETTADRMVKNDALGLQAKREHHEHLQLCRKCWVRYCDRLFSAIDFFRRSSLAAWAKSCSPKLIWSSSMLHFNQAKLFKFKFQHLYILQCLSSKMLLLSRTIIEPSFSFTICVIQTTEKYSVQRCLSYFNSLNSWRCWSQSWSR